VQEKEKNNEKRREITGPLRNRSKRNAGGGFPQKLKRKGGAKLVKGKGTKCEK